MYAKTCSEEIVTFPIAMRKQFTSLCQALPHLRGFLPQAHQSETCFWPLSGAHHLSNTVTENDVSSAASCASKGRAKVKFKYKYATKCLLF